MRNTPIQKPDVGGTMSKGKRIAFIVFLCLFVGASVYMSFNMISRETFEFEYTENYNDTGAKGYIFKGFNGNNSTKDVYIEHPMEKVNGEWVEGKGDVIAIEQYTFVSDEYVEYVHIGKSVEYIEDQAFVYLKKLRAFYVDEENPNYCSVNGILYTKDMTEIISYPICHCTQVVIDDIKETGEVSNIGIENVQTFTVEGKYVPGDEAASTIYPNIKNYIKTNYAGDFDYFNEFKEISQLLDEKIYSPYIGTYYHVTEMDDNSVTIEFFWTCDEKYDIPESVTRIDSKAFYKCDRLTAIAIPDNVTYIGDMAFFNCWRLSEIKLPSVLEEIGDDGFSYCSGIKYAVFIPKSVKTIGHHCFYKCNENLDFYMEAKDDSGMSIGGRWQPRSDNSFKAKDPLWGKTEADYHAYIDPLIKADEEAAAKAAEEAANGTQTTQESGDDLNSKLVIIIMAIFFVPGFLFIALQCIRNIIKEDFLMTRKGKEKLAKQKEEKERIHQSYLKEQNKIIEETEEGEDSE